jgi:phosphoenolpyruvate carboxykinase (ATP)
MNKFFFKQKKNITVSSNIQNELNTIFNTKNKKIYYNLSYIDILKHERLEKIGNFTKDTNTLTILSGEFTGRSPNDRYIVEHSNKIHWGDINRPMTSTVFQKLYSLVQEYYETLPSVFVFDAKVGRGQHQKKIRFLTENAWQHHFLKNMFQAVDFNCQKEVDFTLINAHNVKHKEWKKDELYSENFVALDFQSGIGLIGGTMYAGEMKKSIFSYINYVLPKNRCLTMHSAANVNTFTKESTLFFGLSGTGKTTLSVDGKVKLVGDDEHGWDENGIFNLEGGCYAKTINLSPIKEPFIFNAINEKALLENVFLEEGIPNYCNNSITENGRVSYPLKNIENIVKKTKQGWCADHPTRIIFLTCDAFGVLPPIAKLTKEQAVYFFLSGYTAKIAGTERGINEPQATFSACFGEAFMPLHPLKYAILLEQKITKHNVSCYLVNTGWTGGSYGLPGAKRIDLQTTRACLQSVLNYKDSDIEHFFTKKDDAFGFVMPSRLPLLTPEKNKILDPENTWKDKNKYQKTKKMLVEKFIENQEKYNSGATSIDQILDYHVVKYHGPEYTSCESQID